MAAVRTIRKLMVKELTIRPDFFMGMTLRRVRNWHDSEDSVQNAAIKVCETTTYDPKRAKDFGGWFATIVYRTGIDFLRRRSQHSPISADLLYDWETPRIEPPDPDANDRREWVRRALKACDPEFRDLLVKSFWFEMTNERLAAEMGIPLGTIKSKIRSAKMHFCERYWEQLEAA